MISFRFHVVSITAVFLAIAIGVVVGTTYVDGAVVDGLRNRIDSVEGNLDDRRAENDRLESELGLASSYIEASAPFAVTDRLIDVPVLLVAARGVDETVVERTAGLTRLAGGDHTGRGLARVALGARERGRSGRARVDPRRRRRRRPRGPQGRGLGGRGRGAQRDAAGGRATRPPSRRRCSRP